MAVETAAETEAVNVFVTGFDAFKVEHDVNPSWHMAKSLPKILEPSAAHPTRVNILTHPRPVRVAYKAIDELIPAVYEGRKVHFVVHMGIATQRLFFSLEQIAVGSGFTLPDVDGQYLAGNEHPQRKYCPEAMATLADVDDVLSRWKREVPDMDVRLSKDAGLYLCDYTFYASLAHFELSGNSSLPAGERTTVVFFHVPPSGEPEDIERGCIATIALIRSLVDSEQGRRVR